MAYMSFVSVPRIQRNRKWAHDTLTLMTGLLGVIEKARY